MIKIKNGTDYHLYDVQHKVMIKPNSEKIKEVDCMTLRIVPLKSLLMILLLLILFLMIKVFDMIYYLIFICFYLHLERNRILNIGDDLLWMFVSIPANTDIEVHKENHTCIKCNQAEIYRNRNKHLYRKRLKVLLFVIVLVLFLPAIIISFISHTVKAILLLVTMLSVLQLICFSKS